MADPEEKDNEKKDDDYSLVDLVKDEWGEENTFVMDVTVKGA